MNTLNYIGCKNTLFKTIKSVILENIPDILKLSFLDLFSGTGIMGFNMSDYCDIVVSNDLEYYSFVINNGLLCCSYSDKLKKIIDDCNILEEVEGIVFKNFSPNDSCERMFFMPKNAKKTDAIRQYIEKLLKNNDINESEYYFLLASLLVSVDKVANTTSVYGAFLKEFKHSSQKNLRLLPIHEKKYDKNNKVYNKKAETLITEVKCDVVYMDPPYNNRQYAANYSPLNYIALYDENTVIKGKTGIIENYNKSLFCNRKRVTEIFNEMIQKINCKYIILSYNDEGIMNFEDIKNILLSKGDLTLYKVKYKRYKSRKENESKNTVYEYIWVVEVKEDMIHFYEEKEIEKR